MDFKIIKQDRPCKVGFLPAVFLPNSTKCFCGWVYLLASCRNLSSDVKFLQFTIIVMTFTWHFIFKFHEFTFLKNQFFIIFNTNNFNVDQSNWIRVQKCRSSKQSNCLTVYYLLIKCKQQLNRKMTDIWFSINVSTVFHYGSNTEMSCEYNFCPYANYSRINPVLAWAFVICLDCLANCAVFNLRANRG